MNFMFPANGMQIPAQSLTLPPGTAKVTIPALAFGPGFPPNTVQLPVGYPRQTVNAPAQNYPIPEQNVKVLDNDLLSGSMELKWLFFDGGMRQGLWELSAGQSEMMRQESRRMGLKIIKEAARETARETVGETAAKAVPI